MWKMETSVFTVPINEAVPNPDILAPNNAQPPASPVTVRSFVPLGRNKPPVIVFVHGFAMHGIEDLTMVWIGTHLAQAGFLVLEPEINAEKGLLMRPDSIEEIVRVVHWAARKYRCRITLVGISFGGGLALKAAAQLSRMHDLKQVVGVSAFNDLVRLAHYYLGEPAFDFYGKPYSEYPAGAFGQMLIAYQHLEELVPAVDVAPLRRAMAATYDQPLLKTDLSYLSERQMAEYKELGTVRSEKVTHIVTAMVQRHASDWRALSPTGTIGTIAIPVYLLHSSDDIMIPEAEAAWNLHELPFGQKHELMISSAMGHASFNQNASRWERLRLGWFLTKVLIRAEQ